MLVGKGKKDLRLQEVLEENSELSKCSILMCY